MNAGTQQSSNTAKAEGTAGTSTESRSQTLIDAIPVLAWRARADGSAEFINQRWRDYTGMSLEQARDWGWSASLHPEDQERVSQSWRAIVATGEAGELVARLRRRDGVYRWFLFRVAPLLDDQERVVNWYGTHTDIEDRKLAEDCLRAEEQGLRLLLDRMPGMVSTMSATGEVEFANQRILDYMGITLEELRDWPKIIHEEDRARVVDGWTRAVQTGEPYEVEQRVRGADGTYKWFQTRAVARRDADGRVARWYVTLAETDSRRHAEDILRDSERALRLLFESLPGMIAVTGTDGMLEYVNRRLLEYGGRELDEVRAAGWTSVLHPDDVEPALRKWQHCMATAQPMDARFRIRRFDGAYRWFDSRTEPLFDERGRVLRWYGILWDVEDRVQAELALQERERELRMLIDGFPGMIGVTGAEGVHEFANRRALEFLGVELRQMAGGWAPYILPDDLPGILPPWRHSLATGEPFDVTFRMRRFDGVYRWIHSHAEPLIDAQGKMVRWYSLMVDIDDQKHAEADLRASQAELAHVTRVSTMGELTASIAHEVSQPLSAVVNNASACLGLLPDAPAFAEVHDALKDIVDDADRASAIIARIRQLARRVAVESTLLNLTHVVSDVLPLARHEAEARRVVMCAELSGDLPPVVGDRVQLQQVLLNLIVNGMDAMSRVAEPQRTLTIRARCDTDGHGVVVSVQDTGVGFADADTERLFEAFYTTKGDGLGMGLAISRSIIAAHGGHLWAEPNDGAGATFSFRLPAAEPAPRRSA